MDYTQARAALINEHQQMEKYDPHWKAAAEKGDKISERPIGFICDDEIVICGDCVGKVYDGLNKFLDKLKTDKALQDREKSEHMVAQAVVKAKKLTGGPQQQELRLSGQAFNCLSFCLGEVGMHIVTTDGNKDE